jgi:hypothetical protein
MARRYETFSRVIKVLDSVPGVWYVYCESPPPFDLVWGPEGSSFSDGMRITEEEAKKITDKELSELEMVLTFGCHRN